MNIKIARIHKLEGDGNLKAFVDVTIDDSFMIKGIRIVQGKKDLFVSMPKEKGKDGRWYEILHPLTPYFRDYLSSTILDAYYSFNELETRLEVANG